MNPNERRAAEHDIAKAIITFFVLLDAGEHEKQWEQMTSDGCWIRGGQKLEGREVFLAAMAARPKNILVRHMISNLLVNVADDGASAAVTANALAYGDISDRDGKPALLGAASLIAAICGRLVPVDSEWRISELIADVIFQGEH